LPRLSSRLLFNINLPSRKIPKFKFSSTLLFPKSIMKSNYVNNFVIQTQSNYRFFGSFEFFRSGVGLLNSKNSFLERKDKDKKGSKKGKGPQEIDETEAFDLTEAKKQFNKPVQFLQKQFTSLRAAKASPSLIDSINVELKSGKQPISTLGQISVKDPQTLTVHLFEQSSQVSSAVITAIREAELGLVPQIEGDSIKISLPKLTKEYRESLVKLADKYVEQSKNGVRAARKELMSQLKTQKLPQDEEKRAEKTIQGLVDETTKEITTLYDKKIKELMN